MHRNFRFKSDKFGTLCAALPVVLLVYVGRMFALVRSDSR